MKRVRSVEIGGAFFAFLHCSMQSPPAHQKRYFCLFPKDQQFLGALVPFKVICVFLPLAGHSLCHVCLLSVTVFKIVFEHTPDVPNSGISTTS